MTPRQKERRRDRIKVRRRLKEKLAKNCPTCEVPGCRRPATDMHHVRAAGLGMKDDRYENLSGLCHDHHMQMDGLNWSKKRWAKEHFWGATYEQYAEHVAIRRRLEEAGEVPVPDIETISVSDINEEVFELLRERECKRVISQPYIFEGEEVGDVKG